MDLQITAVVRQWLNGNHAGVQTGTKQQLLINRGTVFSVLSVPRYYKQNMLGAGVSEAFVGELGS
jgi:hypothetical protein